MFCGLPAIAQRTSGIFFLSPSYQVCVGGRRSNTDLMRKLIQSGAMCQMSFHVTCEGFLHGIIPISPLSLLRLLDCLLDPSGIFIQSNLIDDHIFFYPSLLLLTTTLLQMNPAFSCQFEFVQLLL